MNNSDRPGDRRPLRARSPEPDAHAVADAAERETAALRALLSRRREGAFVDAEEMDARLAGMIADRRRAPSLDRR